VTTRRRESARHLGRLGLLGLLAGTACAELTLRALFYHPALLVHAPARVQAFFQDFYSVRRRIIQFDPACARRDAELLYTLRPGRFVFSNVEFQTPYEVNSLGVRDTEAALRGPEIVVLGDSVAMGWGVQQDETFARIIERETGRRVLNAGISSYGTVRALKLLGRVDTSRTRTLIIQYNDNDEMENEAFQKAGNRHVPTQDATLFEPGGGPPGPSPSLALHAFAILRGHEDLRDPIPHSDRVPDSAQETAARYFLNALTHAPTKDLSAMRLIVFDKDRHDGFVRALERLCRAPHHPPHIRAMTVLDVSPRMTDANHFLLDEHPNAAGHRALAGELIRALAH
jgi:hypothetical protein